MALLTTTRLLCLSRSNASFVQGVQLAHFHKSSSPILNRSKAITVWQDLKEVRTSPTPALSLGLTGLIPFVASPLYMTNSCLYLPGIATAQLTYGAVILSFLGGVRWGILVLPGGPITPTWFQYCWAVSPTLIGWCALLLPSPSLGLVTCMTGLGVAGYVDLVQYGYPKWFKGLRFALTSIAVLSLWSTLMCKLLLQEAKWEKKTF